MSNRIFRIGLMAAGLAVLAALLVSEAGADCDRCVTPPYYIHGFVKWSIGNPAPNGTIVHIMSQDDPPYSENCVIGNGEYYITPGVCPVSIVTGTFDIWATYDNGTCKWTSQVETEYWNGTFNVEVDDLILNPDPFQAPECY